MAENSTPENNAPETAADAGEISVARNEQAGRFEIFVDGEVAGFADFSDADGVRTMPHTVIDPAHGGRGLGGVLVREALDDARAKGLKVAPHCSFVAGFIEKHPDDYGDLVS